MFSFPNSLSFRSERTCQKLKTLLQLLWQSSCSTLQFKKCLSNWHCGRKHRTLLHESFGDNNQRVKPPSAVKSVQLYGTGHVALVPVELSNGVKTLDTYAYLDNGSCQSLLLTSAASELEIDMNTVAKMPISGYHTTREIDCSQVSVQIKPYRSQNSSVVSIDVLAVPDLNMTPVKTTELNKLCSKFDHLKHITFPNVKQNQVCIIIGIDNLDLIHYNEIVKGPKNTPWAVKTPLGWTCAGKTNIIADEQNPVLKTQICSHGQLDNELFTKVQDWMKIENYGIASKKKALSKNDEKALEILQSTTRFKNGHYEVGLLWKENAKLPNNRWLAEKQLKQLKAKLSIKPVLREKYEETLQKDLQNGYVVKIDPCTDNTKSVSYLPHHPVSNENKPGKIPTGD